MFMNKVKLVTFDATNTLLKFCILPWEYYAKVALEHGQTVTKDGLKEQFIKNYKNLTKEHPNFGKESIQWENWWRKVVCGSFNGQINDTTVKNNIASTLIDDFSSPKCWCLATGTMKLMNYLQEHKIPLGVISNFDPRLHIILSNMSIQSYFKFVLTSYEAGYSKPDKRIFEMAIKKSDINVLPKECLHIGDDLEKDYEGAIAAGWQAVLVTEKKENVKEVNQNHIFNNLNELSQKMRSDNLFK